MSPQCCRIEVLFISKTLQYPSCACVRNIIKIVAFVTGNVKLVSFSLFLDAFPPRPKMPFGHRHVAINIYNVCKGLLGSRGKGVVEAKEDIKHLTKKTALPNGRFYCTSTV